LLVKEQHGAAASGGKRTVSLIERAAEAAAAAVVVVKAAARFEDALKSEAAAWSLFQNAKAGVLQIAAVSRGKYF